MVEPAPNSLGPAREEEPRAPKGDVVEDESWPNLELAKAEAVVVLGLSFLSVAIVETFGWSDEVLAARGSCGRGVR